MKRTKLTLVLVLCLVAVMALAACGGGGSTTTTAPPASSAPASTGSATPSGTNPSGKTDPIKFAMITDLTGIHAVGGTDARNGAKVAIEMKGEVIGRKVEFVDADAGTPEKVVTEFERLSGTGIKLFIGGYAGSHDVALQKVLDAKGCMAISTCVANDSIWQAIEKGEGKNYFQFGSAIINIGIQMSKMGQEFYAKAYDGKKATEVPLGIVWNSTVEYWGRPIADQLKADGFNVVVEEGYPVETKDFTQLITKLKNAKVQILMLCQTSGDGPVFLKKMRESEKAGWKIDMILTSGIFYDQQDAVDLAGSGLLDGILSLINPNANMKTSAVPGLDEFIAAFEKAYGRRPTSLSMNSLGAANLYFKIIEKAGCGDEDVNKLVETALTMDIEAKDMPNYLGVKFDEKTHRNMRAGNPYLVSQWQADKNYIVYPEEVKTADINLPYDPAKAPK